jgi:hypothetical protein
MSEPQVADAETEQTINVIDNLNAENAATECMLHAAVAEVASLKRKYEPDDGIIIDQLLKLTDEHATSFMRVLVHVDSIGPHALRPRGGCHAAEGESWI